MNKPKMIGRAKGGGSSRVKVPHIGPRPRSVPGGKIRVVIKSMKKLGK